LRREGHPVGEEALLRLRVQMVKQMGLRKAPMLLAHPTEGPLLLGMVHPVIIVPEAMLAGSEEELQLALAHELAHVRRRDILWGWLPVVAELLFFFHPLVYLARREYRLAQEIATDTQALHRTGAAPKAYGAMLVNGAAVQAGFRPVPVAVGIMESYLVLHRRLTAMKHVAISPRQYALAGILVCLLSLVSLVPWRLSAADFTPNIPPPPKQPVPNARELYIAANQKVIHPQVIFNRYTYNYEDINDMAQAGLQPGVGTMPDRGIMPVPPLETMQEITRANQPALDLLRKGFDVEYCEVPCRSFDTQFPHNAQFRNLTRALVADGYTRSCSGDWAGGMKSYLDGMRLGADPPHGGVYISMLVGIAIQSIARQPAWENVPHLSTAEAGIAAHRLETIMARHVPVADIVWEDKWSMEAGLLELLQKPDWRETLAKRWSIDDKGKARLKAISSSTILANIDRYMNALIEKAKLPYAAHDEPITVPDDPLCNSLSTSFRKIFFKDASNVSQNALLLVSLALQAYRAEHGNYPETLAELTPAYITAIPDDPFALQAPVCYKRAADGYLLYSIGPDGKDDGGMPCNGGQKAGDTGVVSEATGDIVAGINRY